MTGEEALGILAGLLNARALKLAATGRTDLAAELDLLVAEIEEATIAYAAKKETSDAVKG